MVRANEAKMLSKRETDEMTTADDAAKIYGLASEVVPYRRSVGYASRRKHSQLVLMCTLNRGLRGKRFSDNGYWWRE